MSNSSPIETQHECPKVCNHAPPPLLNRLFSYTNVVTTCLILFTSAMRALLGGHSHIGSFFITVSSILALVASVIWVVLFILIVFSRCFRSRNSRPTHQNWKRQMKDFQRTPIFFLKKIRLFFSLLSFFFLFPLSPSLTTHRTQPLRDNSLMNAIDCVQIGSSKP